MRLLIGGGWPAMAQIDPDRWAVRISLAGYVVSSALPTVGDALGLYAFFGALVYPPAWPLFAANFAYWAALRSAHHGEWGDAARRAWLATLAFPWAFLPIYPVDVDGRLRLDVGFGAWVSSMGMLALYATVRAAIAARESAAEEAAHEPEPELRIAEGPVRAGTAGTAGTPPGVMTCFGCRRRLPRPPGDGIRNAPVACPHCGAETPVPTNARRNV